MWNFKSLNQMGANKWD